MRSVRIDTRRLGYVKPWRGFTDVDEGPVLECKSNVKPKEFLLDFRDTKLVRERERKRTELEHRRRSEDN